MKAVAYLQPLPIDHPDALLDADLPEPEPTGHDLRVRVAAVSVNPADTKIRRGVKPAAGQPKVLGWDAVGVVDAVGDAVTLFKPGERVWYAGDITRSGSNAEFQCVDERLVGRAPATLSDAEAAALPLTAITAWELLFDRFGVTPDPRGTLLVVGGAGGVGSVLIQLARQLTALAVVATAVARLRSRSGNHSRERKAGEATASGATAPLRNCATCTAPRAAACSAGCARCAGVSSTGSLNNFFASRIRLTICDVFCNRAKE
jgi:zinc-binding alcohol dehydrogenase family protein